MSDRPHHPRAGAAHPDSLARVLEQWHFEETPVKANHWDERKPGSAAGSHFSIRQTLRPKDKPERILLDDRLVPEVWSSFAPYLSKNAHDALYAQPSDLASKLIFLKELVQAEPKTYLEDSFNTQGLENITLGFLDAIDEHLPPEQKACPDASADGRGVSFQSTVQTGAGVFQRFIGYLRSHGNVLTFDQFFNLTSTEDNDTFSLIAKMSISCVARTPHFILCDFNSWQYGTLVPRTATDSIGDGAFDIVVSPLLPFTSVSPCMVQFKARLFYDHESVRKIARDRVAVVLTEHSQTERNGSNAGPQATTSGATRSRDGYSLRELPKPGGSRVQGGRGGTSSTRTVRSLTELSRISSFTLSFPNGSTPLNPIFRRAQDSQPGSDESFESAGSPDIAYSLDSLDSAASLQPGSPLLPHVAPVTATIPSALQLSRELGRGSTSIAYLSYLTNERDSNFVVKLPVKPSHDVEAKLLEEAKILGRLSDVSYVCHALAYLEGDDKRYKCALLLEYGGRAFSEWEELSLSERTDIYGKLVDLHTVHGIRHGDVRPENVVSTDAATSTEQGRFLRLIDFAWAETHDCAGEGACWELEKFRFEAGLQDESAEEAS